MLAERQTSAVDDHHEQERGEKVPVDLPHHRAKPEPDRERSPETDRKAMTLRKRRIGQRIGSRHRIDGETAQRTTRDERGVVIKREEDIDRARRDRQRRDHRADQSAGALRAQRSDHDEEHGHAHLDREGEPKGEREGHGSVGRGGEGDTAANPLSARPRKSGDPRFAARPGMPTFAGMSGPKPRSRSVPVFTPASSRPRPADRL